MAKDKITEYDATANNNTVVGDVNLAENSALPSDMNNAIREVMSHQKEAFGSGTPLFVDQTNNRVGVNKTPTVALDVSGQEIITTADNSVNLSLVSTDADANSGPELELYRNSASPADNDFVGTISFQAENDAGEKIEYGVLKTRIVDASDGTEDFRMTFEGKVGGSDVQLLKMDNSNIVFNEDSKDIDFRVESDNDANAFFVEGDTGNVAIGTNDPTVQDAGMRMLHIHNSATDGTGRSSIKLTNGDSTLAASRGAIITLDDAAQLTIGAFESSGKIVFTTGGTTTRATIDSSGRFLRGSTTDLTGICQSFFKNIHQGEGGIGIGNNDGANTTNAMIFRNSNGNIGSIQTSSSSTFFNTSSDYRLKENVDYDFDATSRIKQLKPCRFNWIADETNTLIDGFLAHEVSHDADGNPLVPEAISGKKDDTKDRTNVVLSSTNVIVGFNVTEEEWKQGKIDGTYASNTTWSSTHTEILAQQIDQAKLVPLLVKTIQELEARITALESA